MESEGLSFDSLWGLRIFSLSLACEKTKKHISQHLVDIVLNEVSFFTSETTTCVLWTYLMKKLTLSQ